MAIRMITAGAGSGKTHQICEEIIDHFANNPEWQPAQLIVTTFTNKAASELQERITTRLMEEGDFKRVSELSEAYIGTVHSICLRFLQKYGYLINLSPELNILPEGDDLTMVSELLDGRELELIHKMELRLSQVDSMTKENSYPKLVKKVIELARTNGIKAEDLNLSAEKSFESYIELVGNEIVEFDKDTLVGLLEIQYRFFNPIQNNLKSKNKEFFEAVREILKHLKNNEQQTIPWGLYLKLLAQLNKEYQAQVSELQQYVCRHHCWSDFRKDIKEYAEEIYKTSADILNEYQKRKVELGVIDYADMEVRMLVLLKNSDFAKEFSQQFKLILVDEFQDTSPLQLEIFKRWSDLIGESIWVGDMKQSIYGFRGADSALVQAELDTLPEENKIPLTTSYRSRKELVEAANTIFTKAFHPIDEKYIRLDPNKKAQDNNEMRHPLYELNLDKNNFEENLAININRILNEKWIIYDKGKKDYRPVNPSDICILIRGDGQNQKLGEMRKALIRQSIPVAQKGTSFIEQAEVYFLFAILRYLVNQSDEYAIAQILYFSDEQSSPESLIEDRARFLIENKDREVGKRYGEGADFVMQLDSLRDLTSRFTISQILEMVFYRTGFQSMTSKWGQPESTRETMNRLIGLATDYSALCNQQKRIEGIYGYIQFVEDVTSVKSRDELMGEGVNVMTYHGAKGLEWPMVFLTSMNNQAKGSPFQPMAMENPMKDSSLEGRWIRFWPWPYHPLVKTSPLNSFFTEEKENILKKSWEEEKRLLYVGFTRARDYLFLVSSENNFKWFEEVCSEQWRIGLNIQRLEFIDDVKGDINKNDRTIKIVKRKNHAPLVSDEKYFLAPSRDLMEIKAVLKDPVRLGNYLTLQSSLQKEEEANLGNLFHQFFAARRNAEELIKSYRLAHLVNKGHLEESYKRLKEWADRLYPDAIWHCEWPVSLYLEGQLIQGSADLILELPDSLILIDHKSFPSGGDTLHKHILEKNYPGQLAWYKKALDETSNKKVSAVYLHFPVSSAMVEVVLQN